MPTRSRVLLLTLLLLLCAQPGGAGMVRKMDLAEMCDAAGLILRGVVVDVEKVRIAAGGGEIAAVTYHLDVSEQLKGAAAEAAGGGKAFSFTTVDLAALDVPQLTVGQDYLLILTTPSSAGLSTMVGLGQGAFKVYGARNEEMAVNSLNNAGLLNGLRGPVPYQMLAKRIRATL